MRVGHNQVRVAASIARLYCGLTFERSLLAISRVYDTMLLDVDGRSRGGFSKQTSWSTVFRIPMRAAKRLFTVFTKERTFISMPLASIVNKGITRK
jgi:hypothetical protein